MLWKYTLESSLYIIEITGGSVRIIEKATNTLKKEFKGYTYLYTGAIHPDKTEFFALENGKHFYIYSLASFELKQRITLPKGYESIDVCGFYSEDGNTINIPAQRYVYDNKGQGIGHYEYIICKYSSVDYTLIEKINIQNKRTFLWNDIKKWLD
jgi:hypothetical protein